MSNDSATSGSPTQREARRVGIENTLDQLRTMILSGELPPGTTISQIELAKRLGVSTTPLREAMRQLQAEGLLEAELNRRPRVPALDIDDLHAIYAARILLESLAVVLTVNSISDEEVAVLQLEALRLRELAASGDLTLWEDVHASFHRHLVAGTSAALSRGLTSVFDRSERFRRLSLLRDQSRWRTGQEEHERIAAACADRDAGAAAHELANHLARTAIGLSAAFAAEIDPAPIRSAVALVAARQPSGRGRASGAAGAGRGRAPA